MNKKLLFLIFCMLIFIPFNIDALSYGVVNDREGLSIRESYSSSSTYLGAIGYGASINLVDETKHAVGVDPNCLDGWYKVNYGGQERYACSTYLTVYTSSTGGNSNRGYTAKVDCASYISVWNTTYKDWSFTYSSLIDKLITGTYVTILDVLPSGNNCSESWYHISYQNGKTGYVCSNDISTLEELTLNESEYTTSEQAYAASLRSAGFKESYIPYLMRMKRNHPNWDFVPYITNLQFSDVIAGEDAKNKIESTTTTYLQYYVSSMLGTEGGNWYFTNYDTNAHFLDPRNFLSERFIFMFEELGYNPNYHTDSTLSAFLSGTWLDTADIRSYFFSAASSHGVSPIHLAARIFKEGGSNSSYGPVSGTYNGYLSGIYLYGYYNFYNIGAYSDWVQGLCFAAGHTYSNETCYATSYTSYGRPWTTIESAIIGGAEFIAEDYIKPGQNTLYFQKFNVKVAPYFTHQYMTNIMAPTQEAENMYYNLQSIGMLDRNYTFVIPVYEGMNDNYSLPSAASKDNTLSSITINNVAVENFDKDVIEYVHYIQDTVNTVTINAHANDPYATVSGNGELSVPNQETEVSIIVRAENGETKTYKVTIKKVNGVKTVDEILGTLSTKVNGNNMNNINSGTDTSSLINSIKKADPTSTIVYKNVSGTVVKNSRVIKTGDVLTINSSSGETITLTLIVNGDTNGDGDVSILDLLRVQKHILGQSILTDAYALAADTNDDNSVNILDLLRVQKRNLERLNK